MNSLELQNYGFNAFIFLSYFLYSLAFLGLFSNALVYIQHIDYYVKIYICIYLIYRFNPFRHKIDFTELDRKIVYTSALFLLSTTFITEYAYSIFQKVTNKTTTNITNH